MTARATTSKKTELHFSFFREINAREFIHSVSDVYDFPYFLGARIIEHPQKDGRNWRVIINLHGSVADNPFDFTLVMATYMRQASCLGGHYEPLDNY